MPINQKTSGSRSITMMLLFLVSLFNYLDRYMLGILLPDIKSDLSLSDTQLGFISGTAFSIFYSIMGIPLGRLADVRPRRLVITYAISLWSLMTALCGLAQGFLQLAIARILVGVGEAGATPAAHSLISDLYPPQRRAVALSLYTLGSPLGIAVGFMLGGWISASFGWRITLLSFGLSGLALGVAVYVLMVEPLRKSSIQSGMERPSLRNSLAGLVGSTTFRRNTLGTALYTLMWLALVAWLPSFFVRSHAMPIAEVGAWLAAVLGVSQVCGLAFGSMIGDWLAERDVRWYLRLCAMSSLIAMPFYAAALLWPTALGAFLLLFLAFMVGSAQSGPGFAVVQCVAAPRARALATASYLLGVNLIGGFGAQIVGIMSDLLESTYGRNALGTTLVGVAVLFSLASGLVYALGALSIRDDIAAQAD